MPVRESKIPHGPALLFTSDTWSSFDLRRPTTAYGTPEPPKLRRAQTAAAYSGEARASSRPLRPPRDGLRTPPGRVPRHFGAPAQCGEAGPCLRR
ncbi:DUF397 domain-containing protein [Streptomyces badius]|uniref:DUF397 domain-containing protein n=1 Tax=Streptomyces badius TaxID=1941 RepID=UPI002277A32B|nr:DUF397 domain-containing protein [Streptomyces badius]